MCVLRVSMREDTPLISENGSGVETKTGWRSCCFHVDPNMCRFLICVFVSVVVLIHCVFELYRNGSCDQKSFYGPIILLIVGIWTPTPKNKRM